MSSSPSNKEEERKALLQEQLETWTQKLYDEVFTKKEQFPHNNIQYVVEYSTATFQYSKKLQKMIWDENKGGAEQV